MTEHREIMDRIVTHKHPEIEELADAVVGPSLTELEGGGRDLEKGMVRRLERIEGIQQANSDHLHNGIKLRVPWALWIALVAGFATILAAVIESNGSG